MCLRRWVWGMMSVVWLAVWVVACGPLAPGEVSVMPTMPVSRPTAGSQTTAAPKGEHEPTTPTAAPASLDLAMPLSEVDCPVTSLEEFQACDGAVCIRAASMVARANERHKILWLPQNGFRGKLTVQAERYGGGTTLRQVLEDTASPPEPDYPSVWQFATTGCWRLSAAVGKDTGTVVVWVR